MTHIADRNQAVCLAKSLLTNLIWKTANIEVDGISFPDTEEIFDGKAPYGMAVDDIVAVNNIKHAWEFLFDNVEYPPDWSYISAYNGIIGQGINPEPGVLRTHNVLMGGTRWIPDMPTFASPRDWISAMMNRGDIDPIERSIALFEAITRGQWFNDGNKRTALMVANHALIHDGIGIFSIAPELKPAFTSLLLHYYETNDSASLSAWLAQNAIGFLPGGLTAHERDEQRVQIEG
jgi:prophage maintenance system killer protein